MEKLLGIIAASDNELIAYNIDELSKLGYFVITDEQNFVFGVPTGETITPVMLMAHIDTVRDNDNVIIGKFAQTLYLRNSSECSALGADDRAGVYICLEIASKLKNKPFVLFTTGEETGHKGAHAFCCAAHPPWDAVDSAFYTGKTIIEPYLNDIYCILQFDRRGMHDVVVYGANKNQTELINKAMLYGYKLEHGSTSDCRNITEMYGVAHLNLSAGFLHEHTGDEILLLPGVDFAINNGIALAQSIDKPYRVEKEDLFSAWPPRSDRKYYSASPLKQEDAKKLGDDVVIQPICDICGKNRRHVRIHECGAFVCDTCLRRIGGGSSLEGHLQLTFSDLMRLKMNLDAQRAASKARNKANKLPFIPSCPANSAHENVYPGENGLMHCDDCDTTFYQTADGVYWWDMATSVDAYFRSHDNPVSIYHVMPEDEQCPLNNCHICGKLLPDDYLAYYEDPDTKELIFAVCDNCNAIDPRQRRR